MKLELRGITKVFGTFTANDSIDLVIEPGQVHALLGENGAGKSTLMNVIYGLYDPDGGEILLDDKPVKFAGPGEAMAAGIGMVHQHFMLVPVFTVAENVILGFEPTKGGIISLGEARRRVKEISDRFGFNIDPDTRVEDLPVGAQQRVEIIKALSHDAKIVILDEPTAVLTPQETDELLEIMRQLKNSGTSIVFITHKLREVKAIADKISVIRRGKIVGSADPTASEKELASAMVGRSVSLTVAKEDAQPGDVRLTVKDLSLITSQGVPLLRDVSFDVRSGEILAIAGVQGNGQTELTETLLGMHPKAHGSAQLNGEELLGKSIREVLDVGLGFVPEDRNKDGLIAGFTIEENMILDLHDKAPYARGMSLNAKVIEENAAKHIEEFDVRTQTSKNLASQLSGGNQQKVVLARELSRPLQLFIAAQPTRGLDVGSIEFVHKRVIAERDSGTAVIIVSTELDEVLGLADRIAVMYEGHIIGIVPKDTSRDVLGLMMAGVDYDAALTKAAQHETTLSAVSDETDISRGGAL
ncbi:ABC transporter ATP-binding protein [Jonesia quinghaiensis]|uniref:ABC transporter ATP-binding protein n=1 Tax=Jonesia quinghaiensis TaxID=262806 RepID=UPI0004274621|nr:ABC transporter ATP-binding protein [Jonesia quinghaiensis]